MDLNPVFLEVAKTMGAITAGAFGQMILSWWRRRNKIPQGIARLEEMCKRMFAESDKRHADLALTMLQDKRDIVSSVALLSGDVIVLRASVANLRGRMKLNGE